MGKFDVYKNPINSGYLIDLQSEMLSGLTTTIVAPLLPVLKVKSEFSVLNPKFEIHNHSYMLLPEYIFSIESRKLSNRETNLSDKSYEITRALDMLFYGV